MSDEPTITVSEGGFELPVVEVLTGRGAVHGKSGSGKSNSVGVIAEQLLEQGFPLVIIDADGEHYGLKEEYELLHVGATAEECDAAITAESAEALATLALEEDIATILDVSEFVDDEAKHLVTDFVETLFAKAKKVKKPLPIFIEEAHEYIPETNHPDETAESLIRVAKRGRKRGLGIVAISQRPANVNKDVITQADWSVWHRLWYPNDTKLVRSILGPEYGDAVQELDVGEGCIMADWLDDVRTVKFKRKTTFDAGETPGLDEWERPELRSVSPEVIERLQEVTEEDAEREDQIERLEAAVERREAQIDDLEDEVDRLRSERPPGDADPEEVQRLQEAVERHKSEREAAEADLEAAEAKIDALREQVQDLEAEVGELRDARDTVETLREELGALYATAGGEPELTGETQDERAQERIDELESEVKRLQDRNAQLRESEGIITVPDEYESFYEHDTVEAAIESAIDENSRVSDRAAWGLILSIADAAGPVDYETVSDQLGYANDSQVKQASKALRKGEVITLAQEQPHHEVDFNFNGMGEIERKNKMREEMDRRLEQKVGE